MIRRNPTRIELDEEDIQEFMQTEKLKAKAKAAKMRSISPSPGDPRIHRRVNFAAPSSSSGEGGSNAARTTGQGPSLASGAAAAFRRIDQNEAPAYRPGRGMGRPPSAVSMASTTSVPTNNEMASMEISGEDDDDDDDDEDVEDEDENEENDIPSSDHSMDVINSSDELLSLPDTQMNVDESL